MFEGGCPDAPCYEHACTSKLRELSRQRTIATPITEGRSYGAFLYRNVRYYIIVSVDSIYCSNRSASRLDYSGQDLIRHLF